MRRSEAEDDVIATLRQRDKQGQKAGAHLNPGRRHNVDHQGAAIEPQHEAEGNYHDVDNRDFFQAKAVGDIDQNVQRQRDSRRRRRRQGNSEAGKQQSQGKDNRQRHGNTPRCDRAMSFGRMQPVRFAVSQVVETIDRARNAAKTDERQRRGEQRPPRHGRRRKEQRRKDESVLHPLARPHQRHDAHQGVHCSARRPVCRSFGHPRLPVYHPRRAFPVLDGPCHMPAKSFLTVYSATKNAMPRPRKIERFFQLPDVPYY